MVYVINECVLALASALSCRQLLQHDVITLFELLINLSYCITTFPAFASGGYDCHIVTGNESGQTACPYLAMHRSSHAE